MSVAAAVVASWPHGIDMIDACAPVLIPWGDWAWVTVLRACQVEDEGLAIQEGYLDDGVKELSIVDVGPVFSIHANAEVVVLGRCVKLIDVLCEACDVQYLDLVPHG